MPNAEVLKQEVAARIAQMRKKRAHTPSSVIALTPVHVDPAALAARIRELAVQNDPDAVREGLAALAAELDAGPRFEERM